MCLSSLGKCFPNMIHPVAFLFCNASLCLRINLRNTVRERPESRLTLRGGRRWIFKSWSIMEKNGVGVREEKVAVKASLYHWQAALPRCRQTTFVTPLWSRKHYVVITEGSLKIEKCLWWALQWNLAKNCKQNCNCKKSINYSLNTAPFSLKPTALQTVERAQVWPNGKELWIYNVQNYLKTYFNTF